MREQRLELALNSGALVWPGGAVLRPRIGDDLSALGPVVVRTGFKPDHDHFAGAGHVVTGDGPFAAVLVCLPRAKAEARAMIAQACAMAPAGLVVVDGQKTDGVDAVLKDCRARVACEGPVSKAHGKLFQFRAGPEFADWAATPTDVGGFATMPGVFSADGPDRGSVLLGQALPADLPARVADLGAGWGYLGRAILARPGVRHLDVVEAEMSALDCARHNLPDPRCVFHWADATTFRPERPWGAVVMNPPFHTGRNADPALGAAFIRSAQRNLAPDGVLYMVANRHLPYASVLAPLFREVADIGGDGAFRVTRAAGALRVR